MFPSICPFLFWLDSFQSYQLLSHGLDGQFESTLQLRSFLEQLSIGVKSMVKIGPHFGPTICQISMSEGRWCCTCSARNSTVARRECQRNQSQTQCKDFQRDQHASMRRVAPVIGLGFRREMCIVGGHGGGSWVECFVKSDSSPNLHRKCWSMLARWARTG